MPASTLARDIVDETLHDLNEDTTNPRYWTRQEILDIMWEGLVELNLIAGYLQQHVTIPIALNPVQPAPDGHIAVLHVRTDTDVAMLKYSVNGLDTQYTTWEDDADTRYPQRWATIGLNYMVTHKRNQTGNRNMIVDVLRLPEELTESTTLPVDDEYVQAIKHYTFSLARLKEGGPEFEAGVNGYQEFMTIAQTMASRSNWKRTPGFTFTPKIKLADAVPRKL